MDDEIGTARKPADVAAAGVLMVLEGGNQLIAVSYKGQQSAKSGLFRTDLKPPVSVTVSRKEDDIHAVM